MRQPCTVHIRAHHGIAPAENHSCRLATTRAQAKPSRLAFAIRSRARGTKCQNMCARVLVRVHVCACCCPSVCVRALSRSHNAPAQVCRRIVSTPPPSLVSRSYTAAGTCLSLAYCRRLRYLAGMLPPAPVPRQHTAAGPARVSHRCLARTLLLARASPSHFTSASASCQQTTPRHKSLASLLSPAPVSRFNTAASIGR